MSVEYYWMKREADQKSFILETLKERSDKPFVLCAYVYPYREDNFPVRVYKSYNSIYIDFVNDNEKYELSEFIHYYEIIKNVFEEY